MERRKNKGMKDNGNYKRRRGRDRTGKFRNKGMNRGR